ncbi:MAG: glycoside hydrolase family 3 protein [Acidothermus sp.]|nr:glycoside hydrolase family 3 protein [Acidothermus sp.]MCL6538587.1 glycoside hydrolase family 3 protein [Acidothermus sp.]
MDRLINACLLPGFADGDRLPSWLARDLDRDLAGVAIYGRNLVDENSVSTIARSVHERSPNALVALDEEGGDVTRLEYRRGSSYPGNLALGVLDDVRVTANVASAIAQDLVAAGVNYDFAPSVDVNSDPRNPVIGVRSFGGDPQLVARHGAAFISAMQEYGVACAAKHFPGHGATVADSHHALPVIDCDESTFRTRELPPFVAAVEAGVRSVMTSHVVFAALDPDEPATLSGRLLQDLLRRDLGFTGVIVTDALDMRAVADRYGIAGAAVRALAAGADLLLVGAVDGEQPCAEIREHVRSAIGDGALNLSRLEDAAERVRELRSWISSRGAGRHFPRGDDSFPSVGIEAARRALRVIGDVRVSGPVLVVEVCAPSNPAVGEAHWSLSEPLADLGLDVETLRLTEDNAASDEVVRRGRGRDVVVVVRDAYRRDWQRTSVEKLLSVRPDAVLVAIGMPDDAALARGRAVLTFGAARVNTQAAAEAIAGRR